MNRLTKKIHNQYKDYWYREDLERVCDKEQIVLTKLGQYEDLEEKLGIDLDILFKALYNGIYVKQLGIGNTNYMKTIITKVKASCLKLDHKTHTELVFDQKRSGGCWDTYYFKDYGKTWALTKEELKDE